MSGSALQGSSGAAWQTEELGHHKYNAESCAKDETVCQDNGYEIFMWR